MSSNTIEGIDNYSKLIALLTEEKNKLDEKGTKLYCLRYLFRRIPLYMVFGLVYFIMLYIVLLIEAIDIKDLYLWFKGFFISPNGINQTCYNVILITIFALILTLPNITLCKQMMCKNSKIEYFYYFIKIVFSITMIMITLFLIYIIMESLLSLQIGLIVFSILTVMPLIIDRSLGFTRQCERYKFYAGKIKRLIVLNLSREELGVVFSENNIIESIQIFDELCQNKYTDTIDDSYYLLSQLERMKQS